MAMVTRLSDWLCGSGAFGRVLLCVWAEAPQAMHKAATIEEITNRSDISRPFSRGIFRNGQTFDESAKGVERMNRILPAIQRSSTGSGGPARYHHTGTGGLFAQLRLCENVEIAFLLARHLQWRLCNQW
ncbi:MAG TPA: hypothetical protein VKU93_05835 [Terracidiphilus sp.]|nr:hypothetical protein [Terracidiphilus sp.]